MTATSQPLPTPSAPKRFGWVKWVLLGLAIVVGLPAGCTYWVFSLLGNSEAGRLALAQAEAHPAVVAKLGSPLTKGRFVTGSVKVENASGSADLSMPVTGPKGAGRLFVKATRSGGQWRLDEVFLVPDDGSSRVNVVGGGIRS